MKNVTRRAFLKTAGAAALAVGMLSGCGLVDNAINGAFAGANVPNMKVVNGVGLRCDSIVPAHAGDLENPGPMRYMLASLDLVNIGTKDVTFNSSDFKLKMNDVEAEIMLGIEAEEMAGEEQRGYVAANLLLNGNDSNTFTVPKEMDENRAVGGFLVFKLKNNPMPTTWSKAELTVNVKGTTITFTSVPRGDDYDGQHNSDVTVN